MRLITTGMNMCIVMLPSGEQAFFYMQEPVACRDKHGRWYRVPQSRTMILEGHLDSYLRAHNDHVMVVTRKEMEEIVQRFGGL
jgi:hypothetical protein